jgi:hypothetical protein
LTLTLTAESKTSPEKILDIDPLPASEKTALSSSSVT